MTVVSDYSQGKTCQVLNSLHELSNLIDYELCIFWDDDLKNFGLLQHLNRNLEQKLSSFLF